MGLHEALHRLSGHRHGAGLHQDAVLEGRHAALYDRLSGVLLGWVYRAVAVRVLAGLPPGGLLVDVGTGPGRLPVEVARRRPDVRVLAVDPSDDMLAHARRRFAAAGVDGRVEARAAAAERLGLEDASVDVVVSSLSAHHWADLAGGVAEQSRVLRPGGSLWVVDLRGASPALGAALRAAFPTGRVTQERLPWPLSAALVCHRAVSPG